MTKSEVRILIFDDPAENERGNDPSFVLINSTVYEAYSRSLPRIYYDTRVWLDYAPDFRDKVDALGQNPSQSGASAKVGWYNYVRGP
jgi:hypothetical protein